MVVYYRDLMYGDVETEAHEKMGRRSLEKAVVKSEVWWLKEDERMDLPVCLGEACLAAWHKGRGDPADGSWGHGSSCEPGQGALWASLVVSEVSGLLSLVLAV